MNRWTKFEEGYWARVTNMSALEGLAFIGKQDDRIMIETPRRTRHYAFEVASDGEIITRRGVMRRAKLVEIKNDDQTTSVVTFTW